MEDGALLDPATRVRNSTARGRGGAMGSPWVSDQGFIGTSVDTLKNRCGVTAEPDVLIRMQRGHTAEATIRGLSPVGGRALSAGLQLRW